MIYQPTLHNRLPAKSSENSVQNLLDSGRTLREIEDRLDWLENQACEDAVGRTQTESDEVCITEGKQ